VEIIRDGRAQTVSVMLGKFPSSTEVASARPAPERSKGDQIELSQLGFTVGPNSDGPGALITDVENGSDAADKGLRAGDVILEVGGMPVNSPADVSTGVKKMSDLGRKAVFLRIKRGNDTRFVAVRMNVR
jgi:serine protease Do